MQIDVVRRNYEIVLDPIGVVGDNGSSGFHALNLAIQFGANQIILVGFDMRADLGLHWHGRHPSGLNNPSEKNFEVWRRTFDGIAPALRDLGVTVINASSVSAMKAYPVMTLAEALEC